MPDHVAELPVFLTVHEVAGMLRLSDKAIYAMVLKDATVPMIRVGGTLRFPRERLLAWLRSREQGRAARPIRKRMPLSAKPAPVQEPERA